ncbi:MAG TPA: serine/threonine-protein kinase [Terriglobales bacterium]|nr:serine/threonine-protein kinase [Terriglobales bacterium]
MNTRRSERFGRYQILTELGRGAMGVVYKARDPKINRVVAVKTISLAGQPEEEERDYRERFIREAEAAGRLSHPGIVTIFDVGEEPETRAPYIVMEYVGGQSLEKLLSRGDHKLPVERALRLTLELAEALDCAHGQGVVHRDLKPANILLTEDGRAKIADFGVAKLNLANQTLAGRALGTPAYMSPEQLNGEDVDGRSDLFSLGVLLYTVLTGYRPFQGNSALTVSFKVVNRDPIPATLLDTELPPGLDYIIARAMAKDPADRYQSAMEMVQDIQDLREGREPCNRGKLPGSPTIRAVAQTANDGAKSSLGEPWIAAQILSSARSLALEYDHDAPENSLEGFRRKSLAGALALIGLLIFGLWVISFGPRRLPRTAGPLPSGRLAPVEMAATPAAAATAVASVPAAVTPIVTKLPKPVSAGRTYPPSMKAARASSPTISRTPSSAVLEIEVEHKFAEAHLSIWVDDLLTYTHPLAGADKKHLVVFHHVQGHEFHAVQISPGKHRLRVEVASGGSISSQSATVEGEFASGRENALRINFDKRGKMILSLQ